jgi:hypothetical protein
VEQRGKLVILLMVALGMALAGYAWWHQRQAGRRSTAFWGTAGAMRVRFAPEVEFLPLVPADAAADPTAERSRLTIGEASYGVGEPVRLAGSRGLVHARHALLDDLSYDWQAAPTTEGNWEFLLRFRDGSEPVTAAFDTERGWIHFVEQGRTLQLIPKIAAAFRQKGSDWHALATRATMPPEETAPSSSGP